MDFVAWQGFTHGFLFVVLILVSTYTANLAAFFNRPAFEIVGPQNYAQALDATVCAETPDFIGMGA